MQQRRRKQEKGGTLFQNIFVQQRQAKDKKRGKQEEYSDLAIQICLTFRLLYR